MPNESFEKLKKYLLEMFQFDENDLDFGLFKIYKLKSAEIKRFIEGTGDNDLNSLVTKSFDKISLQSQKANLAELEIFLSKLNQQPLLLSITDNKSRIQTFIDTVDADAEKIHLTSILNEITGTSNLKEEFQNKIYNYILDFFGLYYYNGDFGYNDRSIAPFKVEYDEDYDGSDTMLFWKHKNQYYIKTGNGFNSIRFDLYGQKMFRLETNEHSEDDNQAQNNNKETSIKHYVLNRIELDADGTHRVIFNLANSSTSKADIIKKILAEAEFTNATISLDNLDKYLFDSDNKSIFKDLTDDCYKVQEGSIKGLSSLKITQESALKKISTNFDRANKIDENDELFKIIYNLDRRLNTFYVGNDSDFFIHKGLNGFLIKEKEKFIKNHILADLNAIYNCQTDNTSLIIAQSFDEIVSVVIDFLAAAEEFQKKLFLKKKKVVVSEYCLTLDNIDPPLYSEIISNEQQKQEWINLGFIEESTAINQEYLIAHPTLVIDTKFYSKEFKDKILSSIDNLEEKIQGLLINSENFQALNLLQDKYRGKVKCIYIDPPYNTGSDGFVYKDNFKHSSWMSMMENRLKTAQKLISNDGVIFCSVDENELQRLKYLLDESLNAIGVIHWRRAEGQDNRTKSISTVAEYILVYASKEKSLLDFKTLPLTDRALKEYRYKDDKGIFRRKTLVDKQRGRNYFQVQTPSGETINGPFVINEDKFNEIPKENIYWAKGKMPYLKKYFTEEDGMYPNNWFDNTFGTNEDGTDSLTSFFKTRKVFNNPKPVSLISTLLNISPDKSLAIDYFAGSGTTGQSILEINKIDKSNEKYLLIEMGEYFESVLKPRIQKVIYSENWKDGKPLDSDGSLRQIFKYQVFEQYEDLINRIEIGQELPENLPLSYLYKPQEYSLDSNLDLKKPFDNNVVFGKNNTEGKVDLIETYNYLKGYEIKSIKTFIEKDKYYKVLEVGRSGNYSTLQIWRNITDQEILATTATNQDLENIKSIVSRYPEIDSIEVNYGICHVAAGFETEDGQLKVADDRLVEVSLITKDQLEE